MPKKSPEDLEAEARIRGHLRQQMALRGITQTELARRIRADDGNIKRIMEGTRGIGVGQVLRICRALEVNPVRLLEEDAPEQFSDENWREEPPARSRRSNKP